MDGGRADTQEQVIGRHCGATLLPAPGPFRNHDAKRTRNCSCE
jgi:hypothetical protein